MNHVAIAVILILRLNTHGVDGLCGQSAVVHLLGGYNTLGSLHLHQVAACIVGQGGLVALSVGNAGQVVHVVVGHGARQRTYAVVATDGDAEHVAALVVLNVVDGGGVALHGHGQMGVGLVVVVVAHGGFQVEVTSHAGDGVVVVHLVVVRRRDALALDGNLRRGEGILVLPVGGSHVQTGLRGGRIARSADGLCQSAVQVVLVLNVVTLRQLYLCQQAGRRELAIVAVGVVGHVALGIGELREEVFVQLLVVGIRKQYLTTQRVGDAADEVGAAQVVEGELARAVGHGTDDLHAVLSVGVAHSQLVAVAVADLRHVVQRRVATLQLLELIDRLALGLDGGHAAIDGQVVIDTNGLSLVARTGGFVDVDAAVTPVHDGAAGRTRAHHGHVAVVGVAPAGRQRAVGHVDILHGALSEEDIVDGSMIRVVRVRESKGHRAADGEARLGIVVEVTHLEVQAQGQRLQRHVQRFEVGLLGGNGHGVVLGASLDVLHDAIEPEEGIAARTHFIWMELWVVGCWTVDDA